MIARDKNTTPGASSMPPPIRMVSVPVADLEEVRDLLMERRHGSPARSPAHNARLCVEAMLTAAALQQEDRPYA